MARRLYTKEMRSKLHLFLSILFSNKKQIIICDLYNKAEKNSCWKWNDIVGIMSSEIRVHKIFYQFYLKRNKN